jgi:endonuclease/exonuclease/phosphatase family metal-dependent hydrolase
MNRSIIMAVALAAVFTVASCSLEPALPEMEEFDAVGLDAKATYSENFDAVPPSGSTYQTGTFQGASGVEWAYTQVAWSGGVISGKTPVLGKGRTPSSELSFTVPDGVGTLTFKYKRAYSTAVSMKVYAGSTLLGTVTSSSSSTLSKSFAVNKAGTVTIRFAQSSASSGQVSVDAITWTSYGTTPPASNEKIKVGSFNIQIFGTTKSSRANVMTVLAKIASNFDLMAIQEVGSNGSTATDATCVAIMDAYVARINEVAGTTAYAYVRGNQYAFVYRKDKLTCQSYALYSGSKTFAYSPLVAKFKSNSGNLDFVIVSIHTSPSLAETEIPALKTVMAEARTSYGEPDVICVGDYNADGSYYEEGADSWLSGFDTATYTTAIPNSADTTVATSSNTYDRVQMFSQASAADFAGTWDVMEFGQIYDVSQCEGTTSTAGTEAAVSDHYPVWIELYTGRDAD